MSNPSPNLPQPTGYRVLVKPLAPKNKTTDGGIIIPSEAQDADAYMQPVAEVISLGPDAFKDAKMFPGGAWCQPGDHVFINYRGGINVEIKEDVLDKQFSRYKLVNDQDILALVPNPGAVRTYTN